MDTASYYVIVASAGHDTTKDAISGGLHALVENPGELERLRDDPRLMPTAVEEMIRWITPVKQFMRTATADAEVRGVPIAEGESVYLGHETRFQPLALAQLFAHIAWSFRVQATI
jgi:cytochrome P450